MIVIVVLIVAFSVSQGFHMRKFSTKRALPMALAALPDGPAMLREGLSRGLTQGRKLLATGAVTFSSLVPQQKAWAGGAVGHSATGVTRVDKEGRNIGQNKNAWAGVGLNDAAQTKPLPGGRRQAGTGSSFVRDSVMSVGPSVVRIGAEKELPQMMSIFADGETMKVSGSGFTVDSAGYILTNAHVVDGTKAGSLTVSLANGRTYKASVVALDELTDLALIKAEVGKDELAVAPMGDSSTLQSGDWVIAVGCPVGLDFTVTLGIVSNPKRSAFEVGAPHMKGAFIQTDAALNQGNSGGPLVDEDGRVVGINTMVRTNTEAIGFAIPIDRAQQIYQVLKTGHKPSHAYFGLEAMTTTPDYAHIHNDDPNVQRLPAVPGSPAALAGLRKNDIVRMVGGQAVRTAEDADTLLDACRLGEAANVRVARGESGREVELAARPLNLLSVIEERRSRAHSGGAVPPPRPPAPQRGGGGDGRQNGRGGSGR